MKQIIERNLPLSDSYKLVSIKRQTLENLDGFVLICDNCNAEIINIATITNQHGNRFDVGLDCLKTLTKTLDGASLDMIYDYEVFMRELATLRKADSYEVENTSIRYKLRNKHNQVKTKLFFAALDYAERFNVDYTAYLPNS